MITYKGQLTAAMDFLARDERTIFVGYGIRHGRAMGTLANVPEKQLLETTVAENLMVGLAIGLALKGRRPVVFFERMDFILNAMDAIVNHLNAMRGLSRMEFNPTVLLRVVVGNKTKPLFTGPVHTQDFTGAIRQMVNFPCYQLTTTEIIEPTYRQAAINMDTQSSMVVEYKDKL